MRVRRAGTCTPNIRWRIRIRVHLEEHAGKVEKEKIEREYEDLKPLFFQRCS